MAILTRQQLKDAFAIEERSRSLVSQLEEMSIQLAVEELRGLDGSNECPLGMQFVSGTKADVEEFVNRHGDEYQWYLRSIKGFYSKVPSAKLTLTLFQVLESRGFGVFYTEKAEANE